MSLTTDSNYEIEIDLDRDFLEILISELSDYNIHVDPTEDAEKIKIQYYNFKKRLIPECPRLVLKSKEFSCPPELQDGLKLIEAKISKGESLFPNLSKGIKNPDYNDALLNDWGIYHLHLGTSVAADGFTKRTGPVLFARFDSFNAYLINVMQHGSWTDQKMIKLIHDNWPTSIETFRFKDIIGLTHAPSNEEVGAARNSGVNVSIELEPGVAYTSIGGGYTTSKTSIDVMQAMFHYNKIIHTMEDHVRCNSNKYGKMLSEKYGYSGTKLKFNLAIQDGEFLVVEPNANVAIRLGQY